MLKNILLSLFRRVREAYMQQHNDTVYQNQRFSQIKTYTPELSRAEVVPVAMKEHDDPLMLISALRRNDIKAISSENSRVLFSEIIRSVTINSALTVVECSHLYAIERVWRLASHVFNSEDSAMVWMREHNQILDGSPINYLDTQPGINLIEQILDNNKFGGCA